jgi:uncharacterized protein YjbI with pentapeptide repeats
MPTASSYNETEYARLLVTGKCIRCDLYQAPLSGIDLSNADLTGSNLISANLQNATLYGAKLDGANLSAANLSGALWIDGRLCREGSYGRCLTAE